MNASAVLRTLVLWMLVDLVVAVTVVLSSAQGPGL